MAPAKVLSRLRKLLALARSANLHEASSARARADDLMARHGLTEKEVGEVGEDEVVELPVGSRGFAAPWKFKMAAVAARHYGCEALGLRVGRRRKVRVVGPRDAARDAVELLALLEREVGRIARDELSGFVAVARAMSTRDVRRIAERYLRHFREGIVDGVAARLTRARRAASQAAPGVVPASDVGVEGIVKVPRRPDSSAVRERLVSLGARQVDEEVDDFDDIAESAYRSGFRRATEVRLPEVASPREGESS